MAVAKSPIDARRWSEALAAGGRGLFVSYDVGRDFFALTLGERRPTYSHEEADLSIQVDLETNEVAGIYIYDFERSYLPLHADTVEWWRQVKEQLSPNIVPRRPLQEPVPPMPARVAQLMEVPALVA